MKPQYQKPNRKCNAARALKQQWLPLIGQPTRSFTSPTQYFISISILSASLKSVTCMWAIRNL